MNLITTIFFLQLIIFIGIFLAKIYNLFTLGKFYDIKIGFILLIITVICFLMGVLALLNIPTMIFISQIFRLESWLYYFHFVFFLVEIFFAFAPGNGVKQYKSNEQQQ